MYETAPSLLADSVALRAARSSAGSIRRKSVADRTLRALHRQASLGDVTARGRQLAEEMRCGRLERERVFLAACLGHGAARLVLGDEVPQAGDVTVHCSDTLHRAHPPTERPRKVVYSGFRLPLLPGDEERSEPRYGREARAELTDVEGRIAAAGRRNG